MPSHIDIGIKYERWTQIEEMKNAADSVVGTLKSLANTDRLLILCHLAHEGVKCLSN